MLALTFLSNTITIRIPSRCLEITIYQQFNDILCKPFLLFSYHHLLPKLNPPLTYYSTMNIRLIIMMCIILNFIHIKIKNSTFPGNLSHLAPYQFKLIYLADYETIIVNKSKNNTEYVILYEIQNIFVTNVS